MLCILSIPAPCGKSSLWLCQGGKLKEHPPSRGLQAECWQPFFPLFIIVTLCTPTEGTGCSSCLTSEPLHTPQCLEIRARHFPRGQIPPCSPPAWHREAETWSQAPARSWCPQVCPSLAQIPPGISPLCCSISHWQFCQSCSHWMSLRQAGAQQRLCFHPISHP